MQPSWPDANNGSETAAHRMRKRVIPSVLLVAVLAWVTVASVLNSNDKSKGVSVTHMNAVVNVNEDAPNPTAAATQKAIYDNEKIIRKAFGQVKAIWLQVYNQYKTTAQTKKDITLKQYSSMLLAQVQFHIAATSENVHLFIEDAAYGLWITNLYKTNFVVDADAYGKISADHADEMSRLKSELHHERSKLEGLFKEDAANPGLAQTYLGYANTAYNKYQNLKATGATQRQAWLSDLAARQAAKSMTLAQHLNSIHLFVVYKITKTAELVQEYAWLINYTAYLRWAFGNTFVMNEDVADAVRRLEEAADALMRQI